MPKELKTIGVIGAGTMGLSIAQVVALSGYKVQLYDFLPESLDGALNLIRNNLLKGVEIGKVSELEMNATLANISPILTLQELSADLVIEAIVEELSIKQTLFSELENILPTSAVLCTNTSSLSVTKIASCLEHQERFLGLHFFNPAHIMKLVEVVSGSKTEESIFTLAVDFVKELGKTPVIANDSPGFIVNRVARHFYVESLKVLEERVASFEDIDKLMEASNFKMGPFKLMDLIGVDTNFAVTTTMYNAFHQDAKFRPNRIQQQKVAAGHLGRKTGKGFYSYD